MEENENLKETRIYEIGFLIVPTTKPDDVPAVFGELKGMIEALGAEFISEEMPRFIELAYEMRVDIENVKERFTTGYFGWIKFEAPAEVAVALKEKLDRITFLIRYLLIKTVRENTMAPKKFMGRDRKRSRYSDEAPSVAPTVSEEEPKEPVSAEELDKQIDALVEEGVAVVE